MRTTLILFALTIIFSFTANAQTNNNEKKPLKFNINKSIANIEKISNQNLEILLKASIIEKNDDGYFLIKDDSGNMKVYITDEQISHIGSYTQDNVFYFTLKVKNFREQTFTTLEIDKAE